MLAILAMMCSATLLLYLAAEDWQKGKEGSKTWLHLTKVYAHRPQLVQTPGIHVQLQQACLHYPSLDVASLQYSKTPGMIS